MNINLTDLSKTVSHALRHEPDLYGLKIDKLGWVSVELLIESLKVLKPVWSGLTVDHIEKMINLSKKKRHELADNKIRALYGHSFSEKLIKNKTEPPEILYHGTSPKSARMIRSSGIKPCTRHFVHLSTERDTAKKVGLRKSKHPVILVVKAKQGYKEGLGFFKGSDDIWLSDEIPPEYIIFPNE